MRLRARCGGFTYIGLIVLLAILGLVGAAGLKTGSLMQRAAAEEELLEIGAAFSEALRSYAAATPKGQPTQPPNMQALLRDPRFPNLRRHLRKVFVDPLTGKAEWGLVTLGDSGGISAVYSLSAARPLKVGNFDTRFVNFENKERISDWKFTASGQGATVLGAEGAQPGQPGNPASGEAPVVTPGEAPAAPVPPPGNPPDQGEAVEPPEPPDPPPPATDDPPQPPPDTATGEPEEAQEPPPQEEGEETDADGKPVPPKPKAVAR